MLRDVSEDSGPKVWQLTHMAWESDVSALCCADMAIRRDMRVCLILTERVRNVQREHKDLGIAPPFSGIPEAAPFS